ncbi:MAG: glycosyl transferase [Bacteroidia bacterium]|nr:MAG: glycosyl transferase [Bacteroidia bacterium]
MTRVSVIVITRNEERNIRDCLSSARWADEIIVVDSGSSDGTVAAAREFSEKVFERPWEGFGASKNFALSKARNDWVFWLDADERITPELAEEIELSISKRTDKAGFSVPRKAFFLGKWIKHCGWYPGRVVRLFRRDKGTFSNDRVHETLIVDGPVAELKADLLHYTDPSLEHYFTKFNRYTSLAADDLAGKGRRSGVGRLLLNPMWTFVRMYFLRLGFLDGMPGLILCMLSAGYVFTKYAKLWERTRTMETIE